MPRRTRIVATIGPATDPPEILRAILREGVDVVRVNFSHGEAADHLDRVARLRATAAELGKNVAVLADLPGPKLRIRLPAAQTINAGQEVVFSTTATPQEPNDWTITEPEMLVEVQPGHRILCDDGRLQLEATRTVGQRLFATVVVGGTLLPNKGVNLPDTPLTIPALTQRDRDALVVAAQAGVDWLALSFARSPEAADELRKEAAAVGLHLPVLAKMERPEAVANAKAIIAAFDGIMVARGDLGVEIPLERVPTVQKELIALARSAGKPVITATDMLDSMRANPRPTRAEASDVANAIYDGTDAVMLSGETAVGAYPVEAVACMSRIAMEAEAHLNVIDHPLELRLDQPMMNDHITSLVVELAQRTQADAIITPTLSGRSARLVSRHRPKARIIAPAPSEAIVRQMALVWGLKPVLMDYCRRTGDDRMSGAVVAAYEAQALELGQLVIVVAGHPVEGGEHVPTIRVVRVGENGNPVDPG